MQRDMDLIREIMLKLETLPIQTGASQAMGPRDKRVFVEGRSFQEMEYHLDQIRQAGFIDAGAAKPPHGIGFRCLTPAGHEFLDSVRSVDAWAATKDRASKVGSFGLSFLTDLAKAWAKSEATKHGWM